MGKMKNLAIEEAEFLSVLDSKICTVQYETEKLNETLDKILEMLPLLMSNEYISKRHMVGEIEDVIHASRYELNKLKGVS